MAKGKRQSPDERQLSHVRKVIALRETFRVLGIAAKGYFFVALPAKSLAGHMTIVSVFTNLVEKLGMTFWFQLGFMAACALAVAGIEAVRRFQVDALKKALDREHRRVAQLEARMDPNRTSSGLKD
ncbi:MAG TPA: hypothetical protein VK123_08235 [Candidatus Limnocylindrales bacterium]|nr:hypothetical protein [Candidatus Limnocylindrales bacterium]